MVAASVVTLTFHAVRSLNRMSRAATEVESAVRQVSSIVPKLEKVLDEAAVELQELRLLTRRSEAVTADVQAISGELRKGVMLLDVTRRTRAALAGVKAGFAALKTSPQEAQDDNGKGDDA